MQKHLAVLISLTLYAGLLSGFAQAIVPNNYDEWVFGTRAHLGNMAGVAPINNPASSMVTPEGCASWSDANGNLLFYTDGQRIWDGAGALIFGFPTNFIFMNGSPNTLNVWFGGTASSTQGVLILPRNLAADEYYIFTVSDMNAPYANNGLSWYILDITVPGFWTLNGPNFPLATDNFVTTEHLTAIPDCDGNGYWVIVKPVLNSAAVIQNANVTGVPPDNNTIVSYHVDAVQVDPPVLSTFGINQGYLPDQNIAPANWVGSMKSSPDKELFAITERTTGAPGFTGRVHLYRFNAATGQFGFVATANQGNAYGVSFSPNSRVLYVSNRNANSSADINQYDLMNVDICGGFLPAPCAIPYENPLSPTNPGLFQLQLDPNGRIYVARPISPTLGRINFPDILCPNDPGYDHGAVALPNIPGNIQRSRSGLPNNVDGRWGDPLNPEPIDFFYCVACSTGCFAALGCGLTFQWDFGDGSPVISGVFNDDILNDPNTTGTFDNPCHTYSGPGTYSVTLIINSQTVTHTITIQDDWQYTTEQTGTQDQGNDVAVDDDGNIYVTGTYQAFTTFPNLNPNSNCSPITITSPAMSPNAYIAKFDPCGNIMWVNFDNSGLGTSEGNGIAIDNARNIAYITGPCSGSLQFQVSASLLCGPSPVPVNPQIVTNDRYYIAAFDLGNGSFLHGFFSPTGPGGTVDWETHSIDVNNIGQNVTEIFVCGDLVRTATDISQVFVRKLDNAFTGYTSSWDRYSSPGGPPTPRRHHGFDLAFNRFDNSIYVTGEYQIRLSFPPLNTPSTSSADKDGFIVAFINDAIGTPSPVSLRTTGALNNESASGTGVSVDGTTGNVYYTGWITNNSSNFYGNGPTAGGITGISRGYMYSTALGNTAFNWARQIRTVLSSPFSPTPGNVFPTGITTNGANVYVTGRFNGNHLQSPSFFADYVSSSNTDKVFIGSVSSGNIFNCAIATSYGGPVPFGSHESGRVVANDNFVYSTGRYQNNMTFLGPLLSTNFSLDNNPPNNSFNTYVLRNDLVNPCSFMKTSKEGDPDILTFESPFVNVIFDVFPNPSDGLCNVLVSSLSENATLHIEILDATCKQVHSSFTMENTIEIDLKDHPPGIYLVKVTAGDQIYTEKLIIQ